MPIPETEKQCPNRNMNKAEILILLETHSQKLGHVSKLVTLAYTLDCNVSWIYTNINSNYKLISLSNLPFTILLTFSF